MATESARLARKIYITYKARANAERRLRALGTQWNLSLTFVSAGVLIATVFSIQAPTLLGTYTPALLASASAVVLIQSLVVAQSNYISRADRMLDHYRRLQRLSDEAEALLAEKELGWTEEIRNRYHDELDSIENHSALDYSIALSEITLSELKNASIDEPAEPKGLPDFGDSKTESELVRDIRFSRARLACRIGIPWGLLAGLIAAGIILRSVS